MLTQKTFFDLILILFLWGMSNVLIKISSFSFDGNALIYSCTAFIGAALFLLIIGGSGSLAKETMRSLDTWGYGIMLITVYILAFILYSYVSATEGTLLQRISIVSSLFISWFFLTRKPSFYQFVGVLAVLAGVVIILLDTPLPIRGAVLFLVFLFSLAQASYIFSAEYHRPHKQAAELALDPRAKARVVGFVMFIVSVFFTCMTVLLSFSKYTSPEFLPLEIVPTWQDYFNGPSIILGVFAGVFILAPLRYLEFNATQKIKTENYLALTSLGAISTWLIEWIFEPYSGFNISNLTKEDLFAGALITAGGLTMALSQIRQKKTPTQEWREYLMVFNQNLEAVADSREIVAKTIEHFKGDVKRAAAALDVPPSTLEALLVDREKVLGFKPEVFLKAARRFRQQVAGVDALTGLPSKPAFMMQMKELLQQGKKGAVVFLDLNKFKPVNDTHGHEAGDEILVEIAARLQKFVAPMGGMATRLGGDEYCLLLEEKTKAEAEVLTQKIVALIEEPYTLKSAKKQVVSVSASVGVATWPEDGQSPESLLAAADKAMYRVKKER